MKNMNMGELCPLSDALLIYCQCVHFWEMHNNVDELRLDLIY